MSQASPTDPRSTFGLVVLVSGHMIDLPSRSRPRFPQSDAEVVSRTVEAALRARNVGRGTLLISGGARGTDIIAAEQALALGAEVWLLLALPEDEFVAASVRMPDADWEERFRNLRDRCPTWFQAHELGPPTADEDVFERNNDWCLEVARAQAAECELRVLVVWDGESVDTKGGTFHLVERARSLGIPLDIISPPAA